jgi:hypothetical protein
MPVAVDAFARRSIFVRRLGVLNTWFLPGRSQWISAFTVNSVHKLNWRWFRITFWIKRNLSAHTTLVFPVWYKSVLPGQVYATSLLILLGGWILTCMSQEKVWCFQAVHLLTCLLAHDDWSQLARKRFFHLHTAQHKKADFSVLLWRLRLQECEARSTNCVASSGSCLPKLNRLPQKLSRHHCTSTFLSLDRFS